jgi:hypothetical protein
VVKDFAADVPVNPPVVRRAFVVGEAAPAADPAP